MDDATQMSPGAGSGSSAAADDKTLKLKTSVAAGMFAGADQDISGQTLGGYQLTRKIAQGGMGIVYEAIQVKLSRKVALKVLTPELASQPEFMQRFEREAKAAAALNHPNIVQVHDYGEDEGRHYLIMEFVEGEDLSQNVARDGKLSIAEALEVIEQAAQALKFACSKSIIHRDIKPSNLMLTTDGRVKVSDLGLAKILNEASDVTLTGAGIGSPHFIAPEQADDARSVNHRADIYSLGITLLYLLTGKRPFDGGTPFSVVLAHVNKPLPTGVELGTALPDEVESLIRRMAAKNPDERYPDYDSLLADVQLVKAGYLPAAKIPSRWQSRKTMIFAGSTVVALIAVFWAGWFWSHSHHSNKKANSPQATAPVEKPAEQTFAQAPPPQQNPAPMQRRGPPPEDQQGFGGPNGGPPPDLGPPGDGQGLGGPPGEQGQFNQGGGFAIRPPMGMMSRPNFNPLTDGPVDTMLAQADDYAAKNPTQFIPIIDRYRQILRKVAGRPREQEVMRKVEQAQTNLERAFVAEFKKYQEKMLEKVHANDSQGAYNVWKDFPTNLRSRENDAKIVQLLQKYLPPDFSTQ